MGKVATFLVGALAIMLTGVWLLAPRVELSIAAADVAARNAIAALPSLEDIQNWLESSEAEVANLRPGSEKRVVWAGEPGAKTPISVVYVHGFSAGPEEIRPVPDNVAEALGANLYFTRLTGHGRDGDAMSEATAEDWMADYAEALAIGRAIGDKVVVISTSTGATLAALATPFDWGTEDVAGLVFVSPNFKVKAAMASLLDWPGAHVWLPVIAGQERAFEPSSDGHAAHWTTRYPSSAVFPMAAVVRAAREMSYDETSVPVLFLTSPDDSVVDPAASAEVAARWGGAVKAISYDMGPGDDTFSHVIAGDILSPGQTELVTSDILEWVNTLP